MKKIKRIIIFTIAMAFLFSNVVYAEEYREVWFYANKTNASSQSSRTGSQSKNKSSSSNKGKQDTSYRNIPRTVINKRNQEVNNFLNRLDNAKKNGKSIAKVSDKRIGTYKLSFPARREKNLVIVDDWGGEYLLTIQNNKTVKTTTKNTRPKDYTWTVVNETTGRKQPTFTTKSNTTYIVFSEPGTYFIQADETLQYDIYEASQVKVQIKASHNSEILQSYIATGTSRFARTGTKAGKTTQWRVTITTDDVGKEIPFGPGRPPTISNPSDGPTNKIDNVDIEYELVE